MKLDDLKPSDKVEDRRGQGGGFGFPGGGGGGGGRRVNIPMGGRGGGMSITTIIMLVVIYLVLKMLGIDLLQILNGGGGMSVPGNDSSYQDQVTPGQTQAPRDVTGDAGSQFVGKVLTSTELFWSDLFKKYGETYEKPQLVLFTGSVRSACGMAQSAMGPFYCPGDRKVYIDLSFYQDLANKLGAPGDFAQGYVIAHEVGHHVQNLLGTAEKVQAQRSRVSEEEGNALSVRMELQADCYAGMWGRYMEQTNRLEPGDMEEGLTAASSIGDDRLQKRSQGYVVPESFTHGTSEQRQRWLKKGLSTSDIRACDTFSTDNL